MHLLLAIDGSDESTAALHFLTGLPFPAKPKVTLVTAMVSISTEGIELPPGEREKAIANENISKAQSILEAKGFVCDRHVEYGHPSRIILDKSKELDVDLIVLGARGHSAAYRVILGSTANFVANHARCSVLVARPNEKTDQEAEKFNILLAYDMSAQAKVALEQMLNLDWQKNAAMTLGTFFEKPHLIAEDEVYDAEVLSQANQTLTEIRNAAKVKCETSQVVRETKNIGDSLRDLAAEKETDLLFVGDTGKSTITRFFLGSISRHLLHHVEASIWIARKKEWN
jgi:nucleotide-binding universal stress UspA family protein